MVYTFLLELAQDTLVQGPFEEAENNLRNVRALLAVKHSTESLAQ